MASARAPRVFNLYDVLGVFFPGVALLVGIYVLLPKVPELGSVLSYISFIVLGFSLGHILQLYSSKCIGNLNVFSETMRNVKDPSDEFDDGEEGIDEEGDGEEGIDEEGDGEEGVDEEGDGEEGADEEGNEADGEPKSCAIWLYILFPIFGPIFGYWLSPNAGEIKELKNPNKVLTHLIREYAFEFDSDRYEEMKQVISSRVDDPASPARSYRFQAIRNFQRGMWLASWILFVTLTILTILAALRNMPHPLAGSYILSQISAVTAIGVAGIGTIVFWQLTVEYERLFNRFLITDYVVLINQNK